MTRDVKERNGAACSPWGRLQPPAVRVRRLDADGPPHFPAGFVLPFGNGRSYGDVCMNSSGTLLDMRARNRILAFDAQTGRLRCEAGVLLSQIIDHVLPHGWFLPVTPGTKFVTFGGAVANDVHGKNHHRAGTFGCHVTALELARSDGSRLTCSLDQNPEWFRATIGGLGLTGLILEGELQLIPVAGRRIDVENTRFASLGEFFRHSVDADRRFGYTVGWLDCGATGRSLGRGWLFAGNHSPEADRTPRPRRSMRMFFEPPFSLVNAPSLRIFNALYYHRPVPRSATLDLEPFFYPLDSILEWNRIYGPRGFFQFQCVVPAANGEAAIRELLLQSVRLRQGSFLAVVKQFGDRPSPGLLSFPRPGPTLALDFPNRGERTRHLLARLEAIVMEAGGALYPAKDACMSVNAFRRSFPEWARLERMRDPSFSSDFWERVVGRSSETGSAALVAGGLQRRISSPGTR